MNGAFNQEITLIVHFRPCKTEQSVFNLNCGDMSLSYAQPYKYLGPWFQENLDMKFATSELAKSASRALSALYTKYLHLGGMSYNTWKKLYETLVEPVLLYSSGVWGMSDFGKIKTVQNKACRYFLGLGRNAANIVSQGDMGWSSCFVKQRIEVCRLFCKLKKTDDGRFLNKIFYGQVITVNVGTQSQKLFFRAWHMASHRNILYYKIPLAREIS